MLPSLAQQQDLFRRLITAPEGIASTLDGLDAPTRAAADALVRGDDRMSAAERLDVYANMYFFRLLDVLKDDYPALFAVLGETSFHNLVTDYLMAHPPTHFSLRYAGEHVASFLTTHPLSADYSYAADLARLEWSMHEAFDAADAEPIQAERLAAVDPERWADLRFTMTSSLQLLDLSWRVAPIAVAVKNGDEIPAASSEPVNLRVWRQEWKVWQREIAASEAALLRAFMGGSSFGGACELLATEFPSEDPAAAAVSLLRVWLADGLLTGIV